MTRPATQAERLTRIETLLEQAVTQRAEDRAAMRETIDDMARDIKAIKADVEAVTEKHNALEMAFAEARGTVRGVKLGWAAAFAALGGGIVAAVSKIAEIFQ